MTGTENTEEFQVIHYEKDQECRLRGRELSSESFDLPLFLGPDAIIFSLLRVDF